MKTIFAAVAITALFAAPSLAESQINPNGVWVDRWGTTFAFRLCGDGTKLCGVLKDIRGDSRTEENLAYVNQKVVQAEKVGPNTWKGEITLDGGSAVATVELKDADTLEITGCRGGLLCSSIDYQRI